MYPPVAGFETKDAGAAFARPVERKSAGDDLHRRQRAAGHHVGAPPRAGGAPARRSPARAGRTAVVSPREVDDARRESQRIPIPSPDTVRGAVARDREVEARRPRDRRQGSLDGAPREPLPRGIQAVDCEVCGTFVGGTAGRSVSIACPACLARASRRGGR